MNIRLLIKKLDKFVDSSDIKILNDIFLINGGKEFKIQIKIA